MNLGRKSSVVIGILLVLLALGTAVAQDAVSVEIAVAPHTLILGSDQGSWVNVHTDIPYADVDRSLPITLNGVAAVWTKADLCGNLVAYFGEEDIKGIVAVPSATLLLAGTTVGGAPFEGSDTVRVINAPSPR